jgi:hypothetical protein
MRPFDDDDDGPGEAADWPETGLSRRALLRTAGAASLALPVAAGGTAADAEAAAASPRGRFFAAADLALVDELAEMVIPADDHAPGARAARVAEEIDRRLGEIPGYDEQGQARRRLWRQGLRWLEEGARRQHQAAGFMAATPEQRMSLLTEAARNEQKPVAVQEQFFVELKREVARAYYTSEIGLKQELEYKGNSYLEEFAGQEAGTVPLRTRK